MSATNIIVNDETPRRQYVAAASQTNFDFPFPLFAAGDLQVYLTPAGNVADDTADLLTLTTDYTVTGTDTQDSAVVVLNTGATAGDIITIIRVVDIARTSDYQIAGDLLAETINREQDTEIMIHQQLRADIDRSIRLPITSTVSLDPIPDLEAGQYLRINDTATGFELNAGTNANQAAAVETQTLASGQTAVVFTSAVSPAAFYLSGDNVDSGRLTLGDDYTVNSATKTVTLTESYPAGTKLVMVYVDGAADLYSVSAGEVSYAPSGAGAVTTTVESKLRESVSVKDFGAVGDGVTDDTSAIQAAIDAVTQANAASQVSALFFPSGEYIVSGALNISATTFKAYSDGTARIKPSVLSGATTYTIFNFTACEFVEIEGFSFYLFGSNAKAIGGRTWRQSRISDCYFTGGYGIDLSSGSDSWGNGVYDCRFQDCITGLTLDVNGQTFHVEKSLFFNSSTSDFEISGTVASQVKFTSCVFENAGANRAITCSVTTVDEIAFDNCQSERLYTSGNSDVKASYDMQFTNSKVLITNSRFWGGNYGSSAPGNSREFGVYLDNSTMTVISSRIYSFKESAITGANASRLICDLASRLDYRIKGDLFIESLNELGQNQIQDGAFEKFRNDASGVVPFSWDASAGTPVRLTTGLLGVHSVAALQISDGSLYTTNVFNVEENQTLLIRFLLKISDGPGCRCLVRDYETSTTLYTVRGGEINIDGNTDQSGLICDTFTIPSGVRKCQLMFIKNAGTTSVQIEECAVYFARGNQTAGSNYSDNDSSYGFFGTLAPAIPYKPNNTHSAPVIPTVDTWGIGDKVIKSNPSVDGNNMLLDHWICTVKGTPGTWVAQYISTVTPAT